MSRPTLTEVHELLAAAGSTTDITLSTHPSDRFDAPGGFVIRQPFDPRLVFSGGKVAASFTVWVCAPGVDPEAASDRLNELVDPFATASVVAAVQDETRWPSDLDIDYVTVVLIGAFTEVRQEVGDKYFGIPIDVEVCW